MTMEQQPAGAGRRSGAGRGRGAPARGILVVEDDPRDLELTLRALRDLPAAGDAEVARDGAEALRRLFTAEQARDFRVVLLDLKLPDIDGREVLRRIRADERTRTLPVVVLTGSAAERDLEDTYALGASSYVVKPTDADAFLRTLAGLAGYWLQVNEFAP